VKSPDLGIAQHWVWVTGPHCYANPDGSDRDDLDPAAGYVPDDGWWRCHKNTREGDQVLLYRTRPRMDIAYRIKARSDAYPVRVEPGQRGGKYGCDYEVLEKFADPMTLGEISADTALAGWGARNARFQGSVFGIPTEMWDHLIARLVADPAECARRAENARRQVNQVREIKRRLAEHPALFSAVGLNLRLRVRRHPCRNEGVVNLVFTDVQSQQYVVVEVTRGLAGDRVVAEVLGFRANVEGELTPHNDHARGLIVGERLDSRAQELVDADDRMQFVSFAELGIDPPR